jgi:hypothetical protein
MHQISKTLFCHKTLRVSVIFYAHHQELSTVHTAIGLFHAGYVIASWQSQVGTLSVRIFTKNICFFYGEDLSATRPTPKLEDHPSSAVRDCLFNIFAATLHIGGRPSIRNLTTRHAVVAGTNLSLIRKVLDRS